MKKNPKYSNVDKIGVKGLEIYLPELYVIRL